MLKRLIGFAYFLYNKLFSGDEHKTNIGKWFLLGGDDRFLVGHRLSENAVVFDIGGYVGAFSDRVVKKYDCCVYIFEPSQFYYSMLVKKYKRNKKVKVYDIGLSDKTEKSKINLSGETSSVFGETDDTEDIRLVDIKEFLEGEKFKGDIDLMSMNIEGSEYALLERIINIGLIKKINTLQVQFHKVIPGHEKKRKKIVNMIEKTHSVRYSFPYVWECFEKK